LAKRGLPAGAASHGDLYAVMHISVPKRPTAREHELYSQLAAESSFDPRAQFNAGANKS
jgi:curved DNA-binding protein